MQAQDSSEPTGINSPPAHGTASAVTRARNRKANAALQLAYSGADWTEIARTLGYPTPRTARVAVEKALERELANAGDRERMRNLANARLNRLLRSVWGKAINPDHPEHLVAVTKAREVVADHRKLFGLDAPTEVVVHNPTQAELEAWVAQVIGTGHEPITEYDIFDAEVTPCPPAIEE